MLRSSRATLAAAALSAALFFPGAVIAQQPDNTGNNKQDRSAQSMNADKQSNSKSDTELAREIRKEITADKSLSTYAHNAKVIVKDGMVTLRGPVRSEDEKSRIASVAANHAGGDSKVTNELQVAAKNANQ
jgi:osmotically-inducible protein OsmY